MGLMTGIALGGMALNAFMQGRKIASQKKQLADAQQPLAPAPVPAPITAPTPPVLDPGANRSLAAGAALKQRKKAAGGSLLTSPRLPKSNTMPVPSRVMPRSLVAGY